MTVFSNHVFSLTTFYRKHFRVRFFIIEPTSVKQDQKFLSAAKGAVAIARYYFYSGTAAVAPLLNLTNSWSGSDAINKVAVAHL